MRPIFTFFALLVFLGLSLIYLRAFGWEEYYRMLMNNGMGYAFALFIGAIFADVLLKAKEG